MSGEEPFSCLLSPARRLKHCARQVAEERAATCPFLLSAHPRLLFLLPAPVFVKDWLGHKNMQNITLYAQLTTSLHQEVFAKLERHPKIVRVA